MKARLGGRWVSRFLLGVCAGCGDVSGGEDASAGPSCPDATIVATATDRAQFEVSSSARIAGALSPLASDDLTGDGAPDLVVLATDAVELRVLAGPLAEGDIEPAATATIGSDDPEAFSTGNLASGDLDGDGAVDLLVA